jgi:hypothetical protein
MLVSALVTLVLLRYLEQFVAAIGRPELHLFPLGLHLCGGHRLKAAGHFEWPDMGEAINLFPAHFSFARRSFGNRDANGNGIRPPASIRLGIGDENS